MRIIVKYIDKSLERELEIQFRDFGWFGSWVANNFDSIELIDVIQEF